MPYQPPVPYRQPYPPLPGPPPRRRKNPAVVILIVVLGVFAALFVGCVAVVATSGGDTAGRTHPASEAVSDGNLTFKVTGVDTGKTVGEGPLARDAQGRYVLVHLMIINHSDQAATFDAGNQKLIADGATYEADTAAAAFTDDANAFLNRINPGLTVFATVAFDVPEGIEPTAIVLHDSAFSGGVKVAVPGS